LPAAAEPKHIHVDSGSPQEVDLPGDERGGSSPAGVVRPITRDHEHANWRVHLSLTRARAGGLADVVSIQQRQARAGQPLEATDDERAGPAPEMRELADPVGGSPDPGAEAPE